MTNARAMAFVCTLALACACEGQRAITRGVVFRAFDDNHKPVANVAVRANGQRLGISDGAGLLHAQMTGAEGAAFRLAAECPEPYLSPRQLPRVVLQRFAAWKQQASKLEVAIECERPTRELAILVQASFVARPAKSARRSRSKEGQTKPVAGLPLRWQARELGRTDAQGLLHLSVSAPPGGVLELLADSSEPAFEALRPRSPTLSVEVKPQDDIYVLKAEFREDVAAPPERRQPPKHVIKVYAGGEAPFVDLSKGRGRSPRR